MFCSRSDATTKREMLLKKLAIDERLAAAAPSDLDAQSALTASYAKLADVLGSLERLDEALDYARKALAITQRLVSVDPTSTQWQRSLADDHYRVGSQLQQAGRHEEALASFQDGSRSPRGSRRRMPTTSPGSATSRSAIGSSISPMQRWDGARMRSSTPGRRLRSGKIHRGGSARCALAARPCQRLPRCRPPSHGVGTPRRSPRSLSQVLRREVAGRVVEPARPAAPGRGRASRFRAGTSGRGRAGAAGTCRRNGASRGRRRSSAKTRTPGSRRSP